MIYDVIVTEQADADLREIYEYIAFELLSPDNASAQLDRLENAIMALDQFPDKHRLYESGAWRDRGADEQGVGKGVYRYAGWKDEASKKGIY